MDPIKIDLAEKKKFEIMGQIYELTEPSMEQQGFLVRKMEEQKEKGNEMINPSLFAEYLAQLGLPAEVAMKLPQRAVLQILEHVSGAKKKG